MKLTNATVAALKFDGKTDVIFFDDQIRGLGYRLRVSHDGSKVLRSWVFQTKRAGRTSRITLGDATVLGAEQARIRARKLAGKVALGEDPAADRRERRDKDALTMRSQVTEFLAAKEPDLAPRTFGEIRRYLTDGRYFGALHRLPLDSIVLRDVATAVVRIQRERGNATAVAARGALASFFAWCMRHGLCAANPTIGSENPETRARDRVLDGDELTRIWKACGDDDEYGKIVRLLILLGARRQEVGGMAWSEFNLEAPQPTWTLPKERSKNGRTHTLPLMPMALAIVRSVPKLVSRDLLFGTSAAYGFSSWHKGKTALDQRCGVEGWTIHDLRRSAATIMADIGIQPHIIEAVLNHQSGHKGGIAGVYNRSAYEREVRAALAMWEAHVRSLVESSASKKILSFKPIAP